MNSLPNPLDRNLATIGAVSLMTVPTMIPTIMQTETKRESSFSRDTSTAAFLFRNQKDIIAYLTFW
jgi:hypothetical protein